MPPHADDAADGASDADGAFGAVPLATSKTDTLANLGQC